MNKNPLTRTKFKFTKDRIQHYSDEQRACADCGEVYYPKVHSQPYLVQFGAIIIGLGLLIVFKLSAPTWLYLAIPIPIIIFIFVYSQRDRRKVGSGHKARYGEVIIQCPHCGGDKP